VKATSVRFVAGPASRVLGAVADLPDEACQIPLLSTQSAAAGRAAVAPKIIASPNARTSFTG
jgi:hypothetical protein